MFGHTSRAQLTLMVSRDDANLPHGVVKRIK